MRNLIHQYPVPKYDGNTENLKKWARDLEIWLERLQVDADNALQIVVNDAYRLAIVKTTPGAVSDISMYLDNTTNGLVIDVTAEIADGNALNSAIPRIAAGDRFFVSDATGGWRAVPVFQKSKDCTT